MLGAMQDLASPPLTALLEALVRDVPISVDGSAGQAFRAAVRRHGLAGIAARAAAEGRLTVGDDLAVKIEQDWGADRVRAATLDLELERIAVGARERPLSPPILLKGRAVADRYRDHSTRSYVDNDLLVPRAEIPAWGAFLATLNYRGPGPWRERVDARYSHHVQFTRQPPGPPLVCEIHAALFMERRASRLDHATLLEHVEESGVAGILRPTLPAQLIVLALHYVHHAPEERRLIWVHDLIELGEGDAVAEARAIARGIGVDWALEHALASAERVLGHPRWSAAPPTENGFGLARVQNSPHAGDVHYLALMRELGPAEATRYLLSRMDPRRFSTYERRFDSAELRAWFARRATGMRRGASRRDRS